jgi:hypothetical protein
VNSKKSSVFWFHVSNDHMRSWKSHRLTSHTRLGLNPQIGRHLSRIIVPLVYFFFFFLWFHKIPCGLFHKPLKEGIFSVSGILIEDFLRNLKCWEKIKNRFGLNAPKLSKNRRFFFNTQILVHYLLGNILNLNEFIDSF